MNFNFETIGHKNSSAHELCKVFEFFRFSSNNTKHGLFRGSKHQVAKAKALASIRKLSEWNAKEQDKIEGYLAEADRAAKVR